MIAFALLRTLSVPSETAACFHCGLPVPDRVPYSTVIDAIARPMCCAGCAAVAQTVADAGLSDYYRTRQSTPGRQDLPNGVLADLEIYDTPRCRNRSSANYPMMGARHL